MSVTIAKPFFNESPLLKIIGMITSDLSDYLENQQPEHAAYALDHCSKLKQRVKAQCLTYSLLENIFKMCI